MREGPVQRRGRQAELQREGAETLAAQVFGQLAADPERLSGFLSVTGLDPGSLRAAAAEPHFLGAVLDYVLADEQLLLALAGELAETPERLVRAGALLSPPPLDFP